MADMALSLTKKAVEGTVSRVLAAIDQDTKLKAAAQQDLRFIVGEFQMLQSFLKVANNNKERTSNEVVKTWVRQLRDLAFDVEDCVEFVIHLDTTSTQARWSWVWRVVWLPSCITPACTQELDQAVDQLKQLKARVEEVSQRNTRYSLLGGEDSGGSATSLPVQDEKLDGGAAFPSTVNILRDLWKANAKQSSSYKCNLQYLVTDPWSKDLKVILVCRAAGVDLEAAHILNATYCDPEICREFGARATVKLMHPFNIQEFLKSLLNQLFVTSQQQDTPVADLSLAGQTTFVHDELRQLLRKHKYLIILEGLSSAVEWDLIRFYLPDHHNGSRIVISTEQLGFALWCVGEPYRVFQLALFPNDRYIYAFSNKPPAIGLTQLVRQLGQRRVISLWGDEGGDTVSLVRDVYEALRKGTAEFKGVNFEKFIWVNVPSPFSLEGFCQCLPYYTAAGRYYGDPRSYFAEFWSNQDMFGCVKLRHLIVIEGLQSKEDWDLIKDAGFVPEDTKSCIVIIANEQAVAEHCEDISWRKMCTKELEEASSAAIVGPLFAQKDQYYSWGHDVRFGSHGCSRRMKETLFQFEKFITLAQYHLLAEMVYIHIRHLVVNAVWGSTGVGKSALVRFVYYSIMAVSLKMLEEAELPKKLYICRGEHPALFERFGWVDVPEPFDLAEFSRRLLIDFNSHDPGEMEKIAVSIIQGHNPIQQCHETIRKQKCLVVIDGLRSTRDWDSIEQAFLRHHHEETSRIFVITIDESIAQHCIKTPSNREGCNTIRIKAVDDNLSLDLFKKLVAEYQNGGESYERIEREWCTEQKLKHANRIVPKCGGLPKVIDAVAKSDRLFWENINDDIVTKLKNGSQFDHLRGVLSWMQSYFDGCSDSVKPCVFYLSVFPTNYKIRKAHLLRRWITEGYSRDTVGCSAKENAERLFDELVKLGIIKEIPSMPLCQISEFFREYIISQPMEDNLVFALEGHSKTNSQRTAQHLTIMKSWEREQKNVLESIDVSRLRSLTVYGEWQSFFIPDDKMKRMRVLDLEGTCAGLEDDELERIFGILLSLKFICLRGCKSITCLPKSLGGLRQLESLDVRGTSIVTLPHAIIKLQKIQYIRAGMFLPFEEWPSAAPEDNNCDDAVGSQPSGTTPTPEAEGSDHGGQVATSPQQASISQDKEADGARQNIATDNYKVMRCWTSRLSSRLPCRYSFVSTATRFARNNINDGVEVPQGIADMPALHTLGTVNINCARGMDFVTKLKTKLPQLLKLSVCGINNENWHHLSDALSAHPHLESLSLGLEEDFTEDRRFDNPPKALKSLRLYGQIYRLPAWTWIKDSRLLVNNKLEKFNLEVIISSQESMDQLVESLSCTRFLRRLCIKVTRQVRKLEFKTVYDQSVGGYRLASKPEVLKIDCSSALEVAFQSCSKASFVKVLIIHCSRGSDFQIPSNESGLNHLDKIEMVWVKGYDEKADYVARLKEQVAALKDKPVFKFDKLN